MPSLAVCCGDRVRGPPSGQGLAGVTQPCTAKHSLALGPPFPPQEPHLLPRALTSTPGCPQGPSPAPQDPDLHPSTSPRRHCQLLSTCICIPILLCAPLDTPRDPCKPPQDPQPCPSTLLSTLGCLQGPSPASQDPHLHLTTPSVTPIASPGPLPVPHQRPLPAPQHIHLHTRTPLGICAISTPVPPSPPQVPTSSPDTLIPSPRNTHPPCWTLTPSPGLSPWVFLFPPSTPAGSGPLQSREVGFD